jgi:hypothetical protein
MKLFHTVLSVETYIIYTEIYAIIITLFHLNVTYTLQEKSDHILPVTPRDMDVNSVDQDQPSAGTSGDRLM